MNLPRGLALFTLLVTLPCEGVSAQTATSTPDPTSAGSVDWSAVSALATAITGVAVFLTLLLLIWQINEMRRATLAQAYATVLTLLQQEDMRKARGTVIRELSGKAYSSWTDNDKSTADKVLASYDHAATMAKHGMLPKRVLVETWMYSINLSWQALTPYVAEHRVRRPQIWKNFEWLASEVRKIHP
jgi:hypothetical protein